MTQQPSVTVVIPCHNDGQYLRQAVDSCLMQTMENIEIIIVDDGSDDRATQRVLMEMQDPRITVLHANHIGPAGARNIAIRHAHGRYILPLDADDWIEPQYIASAAAVLDASSEVGIVYCRAKLFGRQEGVWELPTFSLENFLTDNCIFITSMFRKQDWQDVGGFSEAFRHGLEDYDFWLSLVERGRKVVQFPEILFHYRIKERSRSTELNASSAHMMESYALLYTRHRKLYQDNMDTAFLGLRKALIEEKILAGTSSAQLRDPVAEYWKTLRLLKPGRARKVEAVLTAKIRLAQRLRQFIGK